MKVLNREIPSKTENSPWTQMLEEVVGDECNQRAVGALDFAIYEGLEDTLMIPLQKRLKQIAGKGSQSISEARIISYTRQGRGSGACSV